MTREFRTVEAMVTEALQEWRAGREAERVLRGVIDLLLPFRNGLDDKDLNVAASLLLSRTKTMAADALHRAMQLSAGDLRSVKLREEVDGALLEHMLRDWPGAYYMQELGPVDWPAMMRITRVHADLLKKLKHKTSGRAYTEWRVREAIERTTETITATLEAKHRKEVAELTASIQKLEARLAKLDPLEQLATVK